ncbi:MAG: adenosine deaminase [Bifidobacterium sp.]|nr:adenosine deaminase [Bifidobacterium sp.]
MNKSDAATTPVANISAATRQALLAMPKAELHLHIEGTLEPELALELARRNDVQLPWDSLDDLRSQYSFENLQSFLDLYYQLMAVLRTADDFCDLMLAYLARASADGVRHAEIFFDPQVHLDNGLDFDTVVDGLLEGLRLGGERYGISGGLILSIVRDKPIESAQHVIDLAERRAHDLLGIGLDSAEVGYPPSLFEECFSRARAMGLHCVAHAGEEGPADYVEQALDLLHAERIDHGVHAIDSDEITARLAYDRIALTMCPLSNRRLQVISDLRDLPIRRFLDRGVAATVNSDDPAYFGGYIGANYQALAEIGFSLDELCGFAKNSISYSFADEERKHQLLSEFAEWKQNTAENV